VILGDEMGLGKTMQSLAAMCHLTAKGATHFLVVCPASVVINWTREVERHTLLDVRRLHLPGAKRGVATQEWLAKGGVAVTTFEALRAMPETQEWVALEGAAMRAYRKAVLDGNFMAMRRAAFEPGTVKGSQKLRRLVEIVGEAADGGRKVIVFSYFRDVLETVTEVLDVHRLLCEDSVDQRILELLAAKREAFDEYARRSDMANATPDAIETGSEAELRRAIVAAERTRLKAA
jgi:SNF2-related domain